MDDRVIQHLSEENRRLKEELDIVKDGKEIGAAEGKNKQNQIKKLIRLRCFSLFTLFRKNVFLSK